MVTMWDKDTWDRIKQAPVNAQLRKLDAFIWENNIERFRGEGIKREIEPDLLPEQPYFDMKGEIRDLSDLEMGRSYIGFRKPDLYSSPFTIEAIFENPGNFVELIGLNLDKDRSIIFYRPSTVIGYKTSRGTKSVLSPSSCGITPYEEGFSATHTILEANYCTNK